MSPEEWLASQTAPKSTAKSQRESDRAAILSGELRAAQARAAAGDPRAAQDVAVIQREMRRVGAPVVDTVSLGSGSVATAQAPLPPEEWLASQGGGRTTVTAPSGRQFEIGVRVPTAEDLARDTSMEAPGSTVAGVAGAATRGLAPVAGGAALGAGLGAMAGGVGALPGAIAGAAAGGLAGPVGDPIVNFVNSTFGTNFTRPTDALENMLTQMGVAQPKTEAERIIQSTVGGAGAAGGMAAAGKALATAAGQAAPVAREVGKMMAAQPVAQIAGGAGAGLAGQAAQEAGAGPVGQIAASLAGGVMGARAATPGVKVPANKQLPSDIEDARRAGIPVLTSDAVPPRTFAQKWVQAVGERVPVAGTGPVRQAQQSARVQAVKDIAQDYGIADQQILSRNIWNDLAAKRGADITKYATAKSEVIDKIATAQSNRTLGEQMSREADDLTQKAGKLYADQAKFVNRINDLQRRDLGWAGQQRIDRLQKRVDEYRSAIEDVQTQAVQKRQLAQTMIDDVSGKAVDVPRTTASIDEQIAKLEAMKTQEVQPVINILRDWKSSIQGQDLRNLELLRKQLGESFKNPQLGSVRSVGEQATSSIYRSVVDDMGEFIKANGDRRDYTKWKVSNARLAGMMDDANKTILESVLKKGDATPEVVNSMLFSTKPSEVAQLYRNLTPIGRANARSAIIARAIEKSGGIENVSPDRFANQVRDLGKSINVFFSSDDLARVNGLARAINLTKRAGEAGVMPPSGVQNFYAMLGIGGAGVGGGLTGAVTVAGGMGAVGGMARLYESPAVRNILIRLPKTKPGSPEEAALFKRLSATFAAQQITPSETQENQE